MPIDFRVVFISKFAVYAITTQGVITTELYMVYLMVDIIYNGIEGGRKRLSARPRLSRLLNELVSWLCSWADIHNNTAKRRSPRSFPRNIRRVPPFSIMDHRLVHHSPNV
jgi:hypothetical protein